MHFPITLFHSVVKKTLPYLFSDNYSFSTNRELRNTNVLSRVCLTRGNIIRGKILKKWYRKRNMYIHSLYGVGDRITVGRRKKKGYRRKSFVGVNFKQKRETTSIFSRFQFSRKTVLHLVRRHRLIAPPLLQRAARITLIDQCNLTQVLSKLSFDISS